MSWVNGCDSLSAPSLCRTLLYITIQFFCRRWECPCESHVSPEKRHSPPPLDRPNSFALFELSAVQPSPTHSRPPHTVVMLTASMADQRLWWCAPVRVCACVVRCGCLSCQVRYQGSVGGDSHGQPAQPGDVCRVERPNGSVGDAPPRRHRPKVQRQVRGGRHQPGSGERRGADVRARWLPAAGAVADAQRRARERRAGTSGKMVCSLAAVRSSHRAGVTRFLLQA